ncbi:MAG: hypothetical protein H0T42_11380 [Deltaproteobacteria bacterium]|nr:hypothetical protein [Deltaproteobacteria bacterium]
MRALLLSTLLLTPVFTACTEDGLGEEGGADLAGQDEKGDAIPGIEVQARLAPGTVDTKLTTAVPRPGFVFFAGEGTKVNLEVTQGGSTQGLDTVLKVYGPRLADGTYPRTLATDEDAGYGKLSKIRDLTLTYGGFYLVEVAAGSASAPIADAKARLKLSCTGVCETDAPVAPLGFDIRWYQRSAERRALTAQAFSLASAKVSAKVGAGVSANWGVVLDIDETTLNNSAYQRARADLGLGYSPASWTTWVNARAATPLDGALAFTNKVKQLGGRVVFVTNRMATNECTQTEDNLAATGFTYDAILCRTAASEKNTRFMAVQNGTAKPGMPALEVVAFVGDNIQDFPVLTQEIRTQPESALAGFGENLFLLPNPMYGSWEKNTD